ncbi:hypothetical protein CP10139811_1452, partial [Chlamydia ibidis]
KITRFLFENPTFMRKTHVFSSNIQHLSDNQAFSEIPLLSKNHTFSHRKTPI